MLFINPYATLHDYLNTLVHISEPIVNSTLISYANKVYELERGTIKTHMTVLAPSKFNSKVDSTHTIENQLHSNTLRK